MCSIIGAQAMVFAVSRTRQVMDEAVDEAGRGRPYRASAAQTQAWRRLTLADDCEGARVRVVRVWCFGGALACSCSLSPFAS